MFARAPCLQVTFWSVSVLGGSALVSLQHFDKSAPIACAATHRQEVAMSIRNYCRVDSKSCELRWVVNASVTCLNCRKQKSRRDDTEKKIEDNGSLAGGICSQRVLTFIKARKISKLRQTKSLKAHSNRTRSSSCKE